MKKIALLLVIGSFLIACGEAPEKKNDNNTDSNAKPKSSEPAKATASSDYSSLFINYDCDMDVAEVAKVMDIPETDISLSEL